ncbi:Adenosylhomocysteinase [Rhodococcus sp. AW25M09]|nr:Adenosylhomocysteinase [Rhodococcus sp. AW25M09]
MVEAQRQKPCKGERRCGPQHEAKSAASLEVSAREGGGEERAEPPKSRRRPMEGTEDLDVQVLKNSPA